MPVFSSSRLLISFSLGSAGASGELCVRTFRVTLPSGDSFEASRPCRNRIRATRYASAVRVTAFYGYVSWISSYSYTMTSRILYLDNYVEGGPLFERAYHNTFSKYFWKNGYIISDGRLDITIAEYLIISESRFSSAIASWSLIMPGATWFCMRIDLRTSCSGCAWDRPDRSWHRRMRSTGQRRHTARAQR